MYETSPVLIATITLMQYKYIGNQLGTIGSDKHSITMVTINDDNGETKSSLYDGVLYKVLLYAVVSTATPIP